MTKNELRRMTVPDRTRGGPMLALLAGLLAVALPSPARAYPSIDLLPPGELLLDDRAVVPQGFQLRPIYAKGLESTKLAESWVPYLYNDSAHYCTIGYGHLIKKAPCDGTEAPEFRRGISKERGTELLRQDMATAQYSVMTMVKLQSMSGNGADTELTNGEYAALVDFVFNIGSGKFHGSTLLTVVNAHEFDRVPGQLRRWTIAGGKRSRGLLNRRNREISLFFDGIPIPKAVPQPGEDLSPIDVSKGEFAPADQR